MNSFDTVSSAQNAEPRAAGVSFLARTRQLLELIRFSHTVFALPFALLAAVMAWVLNARAEPPVGWRWQELAGILWCMVAARSAAMAFNRLADYKIDAKNPRTRGRHLPAGILSVASVTVFALLSSVLFLAGTLLFLPNRLPVYLALPVLVFLLAYSYTKRFTILAHFWLGAALMLAPICAWIAIRGQFVLIDPSDLLAAVLLGGAVLLWVAGFDILYACQDAAFDREYGLHSLPARVGVAESLRIAATCHAGTVFFLAGLPLAYPDLAWIYFCGLAGVAVLLVYGHRLVRPDDLTRVNAAFFHVNAVISVGLLAIVGLDLWL